eukprot:1823707-Pleurochrysis_carterae.AAC.2
MRALLGCIFADIHVMRMCDPVVHMRVPFIRLAFANVLAVPAQFSYHSRTLSPPDEEPEDA